MAGGVGGIAEKDGAPLEVGGERGEVANRLPWRGRIDRIDLGTWGGQSVFSIIDYKSGRSESARVKAIFEGSALQLSLYALATEWSASGAEGRFVDPVDTDYGLREGAHIDPDGNLLRYGSPLPD